MSAPEWERHLMVTVYAHLRDETRLSHRVSAADPQFAALHLDGTNSADLALFADRAGLVRLGELIADTLVALDARATATESESAAVPAA